jgi:hypothetical protein
MRRALVPEDLDRNGRASRERSITSLVRAGLCIARTRDEGPIGSRAPTGEGLVERRGGAASLTPLR